MAKIHIVTNDGVLFNTIDVSAKDIETQIGKQCLLSEILGWLEVIDKSGNEDANDFEEQLRIRAAKGESDG